MVLLYRASVLCNGCCTPYPVSGISYKPAMLTNNTRMMLQHLLVPFLYFTRQVFAIAHPSWLWKLSMEQASRIYMYAAWYADLLRTMSPDTVL